MNLFKMSVDHRRKGGREHRHTPFCNDGLLSSAAKMVLIIVCYASCNSVESARSPPTPIVVNKCCRNGEQLDANQQCLNFSTEHWWPPIFMIAKQDYYKTHGDAPRFFKVREQWPPSCEHVELIVGTHNIVLFSNGTLYLPERKTTVDSDSFCVDKDVALVCLQRPQGMNSLRAPFGQTKIRKCCLNENEIYEASSSRCVAVGGGGASTTSFAKKLLQNTSSIEYLYGLPICDKEGYAVAGKFDETKLDTSTGTLYLSEGTFRTDQYCLEHFNDSDTIEVNVMTCAKYLTPNTVHVSVFFGGFLGITASLYEMN